MAPILLSFAGMSVSSACLMLLVPAAHATEAEPSACPKVEVAVQYGPCQHGPIMTMRDKPWLFRTYAGHSTAADSNKLFRTNLSKGQTGLSVAFDLPTQTGYDSDHVLSRGEVGKVGVPVSHIGDMRTLFDQIPLATMNTSMTINATAAWLLALYVAVAEEQGAPRASLSGTTQNDIIKEYLSRGTYVFPPAPSMRLITDTIAFSTGNCRSGTR